MTEAERLAEDLHRQFMNDDTNFDTMIEASIELRRLSAELAECKAAYESQFKELHALKASLGEPVAWHTEDHLTDRSATTYSKDMMYRWESKGWPITALYKLKNDKP